VHCGGGLEAEHRWLHRIAMHGDHVQEMTPLGPESVPHVSRDEVSATHPHERALAHDGGDAAIRRAGIEQIRTRAQQARGPLEGEGPSSRAIR